MGPRTVVLDCAAGNLNSVRRALERLGVSAEVTSSADGISRAGKIILPGVGHFGRAMAELRSRGLVDALNEAALAQRKPVLGICLGMELMAKRSDEGDADGLGWFDADVVRFEFDDRQRYKVPHMGWNTVAKSGDPTLLRGVDDADEFYFAHAYHLTSGEKTDVAGETTYETAFPSVIERDNIFGVQFHPEKSHAAGLKVLRNFTAI